MELDRNMWEIAEKNECIKLKKY